MAAAKKMFFCDFCVEWVFISVIQSPRFTNDYKFDISVNAYL